ncbi:MAG TPA: hypothetical protein VHX14_11750 [Thermoanaerobaculia bacterium]|jgi:hypothetical protein|nr:hypothetical protein [Thermoanaerobaculia bacterium]
MRFSAILAVVLLFGCVSTSVTSGRSVRGLTLHSPRLPSADIHIQKGFRYLGRFSYSLDSGFEGERFVFADAQGTSLHRLVIVHFEQVKSGSAEVYRYDFGSAEKIGLYAFNQNCFSFSGARQINSHPRDEGEMTNNFLLDHGFGPPKLWLVSRYVTLGASDRKSELIVFYMEGSDLQPSDLSQDDKPTALWTEIKSELAARGRTAFSID